MASHNIVRDYKFVRKIGQGGEGSIDLLRKADGSGQLIVRKTTKEFKMHYDKVPREVKILRDVLGRHPRIPDFLGYQFEVSGRSDQLLTYYDYCAGGDLDRFRIGGVGEKFLRHVFGSVAEALAYLHYGFNRNVRDGSIPRGWRRVVHCDLKADNVFLRTPLTGGNPYPKIVLGDFGFATTMPVGQCPGNPASQPPEYPITSALGDVWSLGALIHEMAHGDPPIADMPRGWPGNYFKWCMTAARKPRPLPRKYSKKLNENMMGCLKLVVRDRVTSLRVMHDIMS